MCVSNRYVNLNPKSKTEHFVWLAKTQSVVTKADFLKFLLKRISFSAKFQCFFSNSALCIVQKTKTKTQIQTNEQKNLYGTKNINTIEKRKLKKNERRKRNGRKIR